MIKAVVYCVLAMIAVTCGSAASAAEPAIVGTDYFKATSNAYSGPGGSTFSYATGILKIKTNISTSAATLPPTVSFGVAIGNVPNEYIVIPTNLSAIPDPLDPGHYCFIYVVNFAASTQGAACVRWTHAGTTTNLVWSGPITF